MPKLTVKDWSPEDRPREKLLLKGVNALSDAELLAILIGSGNKEETSVQLSQRILQSVENNLNQLGKLSIDHLINHFIGIGEAKAIAIVAALELGRRRRSSKVINLGSIRYSKDIYDLFHPLMADLYHEEFWILFLNRANKIIDKMKLSQGGISETTVDNRIIYKEALIRLASSLVICHNHPSGNVNPSKQDELITFKLRDGLKVLDMTLIDHIIVCDKSYYSFADEGKL
ncbi:MAG: DNA repair protein RadC [Dysgonamonadaceae bacterium]|jgi:DNA repair protein RadC|nr:DNA repair protein RadC [Dysgonamonadaceae bacterium]